MEAASEVKTPVWPEPGATQPDVSNHHPVSTLAARIKAGLAEVYSENDKGEPVTRGAAGVGVHLFVEADYHPERGWNTAPGELQKVDKDSSAHGPSEHEQAIAKVASSLGCEVKILARYGHGVEARFTPKK